MTYHAFQNDAGDDYGSFEVFYAELGERPTPSLGWYWWPCFPGCLPDGEAIGPFQSEEDAVADALGED